VKKIWITGERGMLGQLLTQRLSRKKDLVVIKPDIGWIRQVSLHHGEREVDVLDKLLLSYMHRERPNIVVHFAAVVGTDKCTANPERCVEVNLLGTQRVLDACRQLGAALLYVSTTATYDPARSVKRPYTEKSPQVPETIYGITKYAGELVVRNQSLVPYCVIRPCFLVGDPPLDHSSQLCRIAVHGALKKWCPKQAGRKPVTLMDPRNLKDYMAVEDFIDAVHLMLKEMSRGMSGETVNISAMNQRPCGEYFDMLRASASMSGYDIEMEWNPEADYMGNHVVDSVSIRELLGWEPSTPIEDRIAQLAKAAKSYAQQVSKKDLVVTYA